MKSDRPYLAHNLDGIQAIQTYTEQGLGGFLAERIIQDAVIRNFEVIGEAANRLSPATRATADAPWARIIAFRNRLIHGYWSVDPLLLWDVVINELPSLKTIVERLLEDAS